jgi:mannosidase alpha-like ER degradation enhancer 2
MLRVLAQLGYDLDALLANAGLRREAGATCEYIAKNLSFDKDVYVKNFEFTIRMLGGLLSSYQLTGDERLLALANDLGKRLLPAFNSKTGMPYVFVNLKTGAVRGEVSNPAEIGTLIIEFGTLSRLTGKPIYFNKAKRALVELYNRRSKIGLVGSGINVNTGEWTDPESHISGLIDSYYEYLLKCSILFADADCKRMWESSIAAVNQYLADDSPSGLWYAHVDMNSGARIATRFGALDAFFPGTLALSGDLTRARRLEDSAYKMWTTFGIEPEELDYSTMKVTSPGYPLRPEIIESAYYLDHFTTVSSTNDGRYREMGRTFLADLIKYCKTDSGYGALRNVETKEKADRMESFFLAETLNLNKAVFNTEAHPMQFVRPVVKEDEDEEKEKQ